jgi:FlaA1/EpsC-like NDP-sugar epimerase
VIGRMTTHRYLVQAGYDALVWLPALWLAAALRFDLRVAEVPYVAILVFAVVTMFVQFAIGRTLGLYIHRWRYGTLEEVAVAVQACLATAVVVAAINLLPGLERPLPLSTPLVAGFVALFLMCGARFAWRVQLERLLRADESRTPAIVFGAGEAGLQIVTSMLRGGPYEPVAVLDDDPELNKLVVKGVPVRGDRTALASAVERTGAEVLVIAIPSAGATLVRELDALARSAGLEPLIVPTVDELLGGGVGVGDIRPLTETDLLGRRELSLDIDAVAHYLTGRRVLVTGAGGSIGSELCRQIHRFSPASLVMLDRDESALQAIQVSIEGRGLLDSRDLVVACIRDRERLGEVFAEHRPQVVFHAAALKHLPLLEMHPEEGWKTNVMGTAIVADLAVEYGVDHFVNISTDKAADPTSVLGRTKRLAEQLTAAAAHRGAGSFISVRFGNVLGSRGSVLPLFREQIAQGGPVTVTDPDVRRYFMTIPEACELVIQAGAIGADGEVMVLDMGEQVRIVDLAERLIAESGRRIEIVFTGLRPGEKLEEQLFGPGEEPLPSSHPLISRVAVPVADLTLLGLDGGVALQVVDVVGLDGDAAQSA